MCIRDSPTLLLPAGLYLLTALAVFDNPHAPDCPSNFFCATLFSSFLFYVFISCIIYNWISNNHNFSMQLIINLCVVALTGARLQKPIPLVLFAVEHVVLYVQHEFIIKAFNRLCRLSEYETRSYRMCTCLLYTSRCV